MFRVAARRLIRVIPLLFLVTIIAYGLLALTPGDPAVQLAGEFATDDQIEHIRNELRLDRPWLSQYASWLNQAVRGDLGESVFSGVSVWEQIEQRLPATLSLIGTAIVLSAGVGIPVGAIAGWRSGSFADRVLTVAATVGVALPVFVTGVFMVLVFALKLKILPATGFVPITENPWQWARHLVLPASALALTGAGEIARQTRAAVIDVKQRDFVRVAIANGLPTRDVLGRITLKNAMIPVVTVVGLQVGRMFGLSVLIENIFNIPGIGSRLVTATFENDIPFIQGTVLVLGFTIVIINALVDISYGYFNPQVRDL